MKVNNGNVNGIECKGVKMENIENNEKVKFMGLKKCEMKIESLWGLVYM